MPRITQHRDDRARTPKAYQVITALMRLPIKNRLHVWPPFEPHIAFLLDRLGETGKHTELNYVTTTTGTLETGTLEDLESCMPWEEEISGGLIRDRIGH